MPGGTEENNQIYKLKLPVSESERKIRNGIPRCLNKQSRHTDIKATGGVAPRILKTSRKNSHTRSLLLKRRKRIKEIRVRQEEEATDKDEMAE